MTTNQLTVFGERNEIKELGTRLQQMMPSAQAFTGPEALAVAQIAHAHGLDPFNGEVWGIKGWDKKNNRYKWYGVMVGIKGLRKCARRNAEAENSTYWLDFIRVDPDQYNVTQEQEGAAAWECHLRDSANLQAYGQAVHQLTDAGIPYKEAVEMVGPAPVVIGVGIAWPAEQSKMSLHQRARKRAEADALKIRYDVDFGSGVTVTVEDQDAIDAEWTPSAFDAGVDEDFPPQSEEDTIAELMGEPKSKAMPHPDSAKRPYTPEQVKIKVDERVKYHLDKKTFATIQDRKVLASILNETFDGEKTKRYELCKWLVGQSSTQKMKQADVCALLDWLGVREFNAMPADYVITEINSAHTAALKESGQQELL
jgi:hypothetical protein